MLGLVPWRQRRQLALRIGTLFGQRSQLWFELTPRQSFRMLGRIYGLSRGGPRTGSASLGELLDADRPVRPAGADAVARAADALRAAAVLLHEPEILFLDEPTIGLDLLAKHRFRELLVRLNEERGTTIFLTSHDVADIEHVARRVIVINHGALIYDDRVSRMRRQLLRTRLIDVRFETPPGELAIDGTTLLKLSGPGAKLEVDTAQRSIRAVLDDLLDRYDVADISVTEPPLEDVITHIYGQAPA